MTQQRSKPTVFLTTQAAEDARMVRIFSTFIDEVKQVLNDAGLPSGEAIAEMEKTSSLEEAIIVARRYVCVNIGD